jgi:hypothetical protein
MQILMSTHSNNEYYNGDCDYAVVNLTPEFAREILNRVALADEIRGRDEQLSAISFYEFRPEYCSCCDEINEVVSGAKDNELTDGVYEADSLVIPESRMQRTESGRLVIYSGSGLILFAATPKHTDCEIETAYLEMDLLKNIAGRRHERGETDA